MLANLALTNQESFFADPTMVCIDGVYFEDVLRLCCNRFPQPKFLWIKRESLKTMIKEEVLSKIDEHQASIIEESKRDLKKLDDSILQELDGTGINIHEFGHIAERPMKTLLFGVRATGEVPYRTFGTLHHFILKRAWRYWIVIGDVPMRLARTIYADDVGRQYIRTNGYAGNEDPIRFAKVHSYHIDSKEGLIRFAEIVNHYYDEINSNKRHKADI
jgi:hypothetical protein